MTVQRSFLLAVVGSMAAAGCAIPLVNTRLEPVPAAGHGTPALKAQVRKVGMTAGLFATGANLDTGSRLAVEIDVYNADRQRTLTVQAPRLVLRDALGGPEITGRPVGSVDGGIPAEIGTSNDVKATPPLSLRPGEGRTVSVFYGGFPADGPRGPVRAAIHLQADGDAPLELAIADPVPGGPRWKLDAGMFSVAVGGLVSTFQTGTRSGATDVAAAPISIELLKSHARLVWGLGIRYEFLYREALASGPVGHGPTYLVSLGFQPWRFPIGCYGQAALSWVFEAPPDAYRQVTNDGEGGHTLVVPRLSAGVVYSMGPRLASSGPFPIERPLSPMRRFQFRVGYAQWFRLGSAGGAGGLEFGLVGLIGP
jgi:hypothetical protein